MHPNALLELCTDLLHRVLQFEHPADNVVSDFFRQHRTLGPRERHTLADTIFSVVRARSVFHHLAQSGQGEMERRLVLLGWQGNEGFLRAALSPSETTWLEQVQKIDRTSLPARLQHNLPEWLAQRLQSQLEDAFWPLVHNLQQSAPLDLRVNVLKAKREEARSLFQEAGIEAAPTPFSPWGLRVQGKPALHKQEVFLSGQVEIQDEGSQILSWLMQAKRGEMVVDFCAGAGGKTLALGATMRNTGRLYAFDTSGHRLASLKPRLARSGLSNVYPVQIAHERDDRIKRLAGKIDRVLVDAPCSGLGTLRRNPDLKWRQSPESVQELRHKQLAILNSAARLLKPGGRLIYATCSLLQEENEDVVQTFNNSEIGRNFQPTQVAQVLASLGCATPEQLVKGDYLRLWPHIHQTDGFFAAIWHKS